MTLIAGMSETIRHRPKIRWFVWAGNERIPHTRTMAGTWGWDAECECGWYSGTGGAVRRSVQRDIDRHFILAHEFNPWLR